MIQVVKGRAVLDLGNKGNALGLPMVAVIYGGEASGNLRIRPTGRDLAVRNDLSLHCRPQFPLLALVNLMVQSGQQEGMPDRR
ncbi:hypothetical protein XI07_15745 [Bradyrhizobium sp. CCBAU 11445]|nr:hypothetical protein [Bradyrhizobium sp. CCBAU 11445]MDA9523325.1 hypothetical protein [Bradyrhizobium sp. CCBAU 11434]